MRKATRRLPAKLNIPALDLRGTCAKLDFGLAGKARLRVGRGRTTEGPRGDIACAFDDFEVRVISGPAAHKAFADAKKGFLLPTLPIQGLDGDAFYTTSTINSVRLEAWIPVDDRFVHLQVDIDNEKEWHKHPAWEDSEPAQPEVIEFLRSLPALVE